MITISLETALASAAALGFFVCTIAALSACMLSSRISSQEERDNAR